MCVWWAPPSATDNYFKMDETVPAKSYQHLLDLVCESD